MQFDNANAIQNCGTVTNDKNSLHISLLQADAFAKNLGYAAPLRAGLVKLQVPLWPILRCNLLFNPGDDHDCGFDESLLEAHNCGLGV